MSFIQIFRIGVIITAAGCLLWFGIFINILGGIALIREGAASPYDNDYTAAGNALLISVPILTAALVLSAMKFVVLPGILDIIGTAFFCYTLSVIYAIPNSFIPKLQTEALAANHFPTVSVTVLVGLIVILNVVLPETRIKREKQKQDKLSKQNRDLNEEEKILL